MIDNEIITAKEVAYILGLTPETFYVYRVTNQLDIPFTKIGRILQYRYRDVLDFIDRKKEKKKKRRGKGKK